MKMYVPLFKETFFIQDKLPVVYVDDILKTGHFVIFLNYFKCM